MKKLLPPFLFLGLFAAACGGEAPTGEADLSPSGGELPDRYRLESVPADALDVAAARAELSDGATVTLRGVVGGSVKPFVEGLAAFTLVDPALDSCVGDGMGCETPWDYCCVDPQTIADSSVTVEFREGDAVLANDVRGSHGLDHLATVVVRGVAERDAQGNVTIVAAGVRALE